MIINQLSKKYTYIIHKYIYKSNKIKPLIFEINVCPFVVFFEEIYLHLDFNVSRIRGVIISMSFFLIMSSMPVKLYVHNQCIIQYI